MGTYIRVFAEKKDENGVWQYLPDAPVYDQQDYDLFAALAGVRNLAKITPFDKPRGKPADLSEEIANHFEYQEVHTTISWFTIEELLAKDYDSPIVAHIRHTDETKTTTLRELIAPCWFDSLDEMKAYGVERIVFYFD